MRKTCLFLIFLVFLTLGCASISDGAATTMTNNDYCVYPLYASNAVKPYILLLLDFSGSMQFPAYAPNNWDFEGSYSNKDVAQCGTATLDATHNADRKYDKTVDYYGYFDPGKYYVQGSNKYDPSTTCGTDVEQDRHWPVVYFGQFP